MSAYRKVFFLTMLVLASVCGAAEKPNILLILADDLGWSDLGSYGGEIKTPNLDLLAKNGLQFTQFYNSARCCPTRASLLTGLYPHQAGVGSMSNDRGKEFPGYRGTLQRDTVTLAEILKTAGYHTSMVGKWHLHNAQGVKPTDRGFEEFYGMLDGYNSCWEEHPSYTRWPKDRHARSYTSATDGKPGTFYATDVFADYSLDFLEMSRAAKRPFFQYLAFNAPHFPLHAYQSDIAKYEALYFEKGWDVIREERLARLKQEGLVLPDLTLPPRSLVPAKSHAKPSPFAGKPNPAWTDLPEDRRRDLARRMAIYAAMVDRMDAAIGRVVTNLREHQELDNTLIIFLSDNGACWEWDPYGFDESSSPKNILHTGQALGTMGQPGDYLSYGSGWANAGNTPWRLYKHYSHEGGIRTPCIVHWPSGLKGQGQTTGGLRPQISHVIDIMPTLVAVSGAEYPKERSGQKIQPMEGRSLLPAFANKTEPRTQDLFFEHEGSRAVRSGEWKLVSMKGNAWELYHISTDPNEMHDLISDPAQSEKISFLKSAWEAWAKRCHVEYENENAVSQTPKMNQANQAKQVLEKFAIANTALEIQCTVETTAKNGVILAHGGRQQGYAVFLKEGRLFFTIRRNGEPTTVSTPDACSGKFTVHASLGQNGTLKLQVDNQKPTTAQAPGLIPEEPQDGPTLGYDDRTAVGDYQVPNRLDGKISEVTVRDPTVERVK